MFNCLDFYIVILASTMCNFELVHILDNGVTENAQLYDSQYSVCLVRNRGNLITNTNKNLYSAKFVDKTRQRPNGWTDHICCGQMAAWTKMPLGTEIGLVPGDFVLDGDLAPPPQRGGGEPPPNFWPMSNVAKRLDASGYHLVQRQASA